MVPLLAAPTPASAKATRPPLTAAHGSEIVALGVTADGASVASADQLGGLRLWPVLDGTREPIVIQGTRSRALALARDGDGFALSTLDDAGGVHIMRIAASGAVRQRIALASDQRAVEIHGTPEGLLILRADQALELVDSAGQLRAQLRPEPGLHIDSIVVRDARALALVQEGKRVHGQWIELDRGIRWGAATPRFAIRIAHAVLSPDGDLLAVSRPRNVHPVLIDLATGAPRTTPLCVARNWPEDGSDTAELLRGNNAPLPLGFLTNARVACSVMGQLVWWGTDGTPQSHAGTIPIGTSPVAPGGGGLVIGVGPNLALVTPAANRFLGYGLHEVGQLRAGPSGVMVATGEQAVLLDGALRERSRFESRRSQVDWSDAILLDDRRALTVLPRRVLEPRADGYQISVFDGVTRVTHQVLPYEMRDQEMRYESSTGLLSTRDDSGSILLRLDPLTHTFGAPTRIASWMPPLRVEPVDPAQAGGIAALEIDPGGDGLLVGEFPLADVRAGATIAPRSTYRVPGELRAIDRAGRLYTYGKDSEEVVVYARGVAVARLPALAGMSLYPSPDTSQIAAFHSPQLILVTAGGQVRWEAALWGATGVAWSPSGDLLVQFNSGVGRVDLRTGALDERRCGWSFGLSDLPFEFGNSGPSMCEVAR